MLGHRITNVPLLTDLVKRNGKFAVEKVVVGSNVSSTIIRNAMGGDLPPVWAQVELSKFFQIERDELFPIVESVAA